MLFCEDLINHVEARLRGQVALVVNAVLTYEYSGCVGRVLECPNLHVQKFTGSSLVRSGISTRKVSEQAACASWWPVKLFGGVFQELNPEMNA